VLSNTPRPRPNKSLQTPSTLPGPAHPSSPSYSLHAGNTLSFPVEGYDLLQYSFPRALRHRMYLRPTKFFVVLNPVFLIAAQKFERQTGVYRPFPDAAPSSIFHGDELQSWSARTWTGDPFPETLPEKDMHKDKSKDKTKDQTAVWRLSECSTETRCLGFLQLLTRTSF